MKRLLLVLLLLAGPARAETVLRYAPLGDLRILDPIWTSAAITLSHGQMIYDVLVPLAEFLGENEYFRMKNNFNPVP